ncbi:MAG: toll/interleukin-1 receptor domain-containing protein [Cocleimonas sp.]
MNDVLNSSDKFRYTGFISYSQKDKYWAQRIHRALEAYRLPTGIVSDTISKKRLGRFFRDDDELAGAPSLGEALESSLNSSAALIVICSPNSARSKWVDAEIRKFKSRGPSAKVLAIIVDGKPDSTDPEVMCFAPSMLVKVNDDGELTNVPDEPLAPDANKEPFNRLIVRIVAGLLGVEFDTLWQREQRRLRKQRIQIGIAVVLAVIGIGTGSIMYIESEHQRDLAEQEQLRTESINLALSSQTAMDEHKVDDALVYTLDALPSELSNPTRPVTPEAIAALKRVMSANHALKVVAHFEQSINELRLLPDGRLAIWFEDGQVRVINTETGAVEWKSDEGEQLQWLGSAALVASINSDESLDNKNKFQVQHKVTVRDLTTGKVLRHLETKDRKWWVGPFAPLSPSGSHLMVTRPVSASTEEKSDLGVWQVPLSGDDPTPRLVAKVDGPSINDGERLEAIFTDETTLVLNWGNKRKSLALWRLNENKLRTFTKPDSSLACEGQLIHANDKRRDKVTLSKNGKIITHARPVKDAGWCVELWSAKNADALQSYLITENRIGSVDALTAEELVIARNQRSFSSAMVWQQNKEAIKFRNCAVQRTGILDQFNVDETEWFIEPESKFSACVNDNNVQTYFGPHYATQETLYGHQGKVRALAYDVGTSRLYSAGDDGQLRAWQFDRAADSNIPEANVVSITSGSGQAAILYKDPVTGFNARVYGSNNMAVIPAIPFEIKSSEADKYNVERAMMFLNEEKSLALVESTDCRFNCPPDLKKQIILYRNSDGKQLARIDDLFSGHFLANIPIAHAISLNAKRIALPRRNGNVVELDTATGEIIKTHRIEGWSVNDVVYTLDTLWILASDGASAPNERKMILFKMDKKGKATAVWQQQAQSGKMYGSPSTRQALIELSLAHLPKISSRYATVNADGSVNQIKMPSSHQGSGSYLNSAYYYADDNHLAMLFSDKGLAPLDVDLANGVSKILAASLPASMLDFWRVDDPLRRVVASVDEGKLFFNNLPGQSLLCPELLDHSASAAVFSPDGKLLAVAEASDSQLTVYDLQSCTAVYKADIGVRHNGKLGFIDSNTLWAITEQGHVRVIKMATGLVSIHDRAKLLREELGLVSTAKRIDSKNKL